MSKTMYAFWANTYGPCFKTPQKVTKGVSGYWWDKTGDYCATKIGYADEGWICFAHPDKQRVDDFAKGFHAARAVIRQFTDD